MLFRVLPVAALLLVGLDVRQGAHAADTGPEHLEQAEDQDLLSSGFLLFQLPFEEDRVNTLRTRTFYMDRTFDGGRDRENRAGGGWRISSLRRPSFSQQCVE